MSSHEGPNKILTIADTDSRIRWVKAISEWFLEQNYSVDEIRLVNRVAHPSEEQLDYLMYNAPQYSVADAANFAASETYLAIVIGFSGARLLDFISHFGIFCHIKSLNFRPITISGFWGIVVPGDYEAIFYRQLCDIICVNSKKDYSWMKEAITNFGNTHEPLCVTGNPLITNNKKISPENLNKDISRIIFAAQPSVPKKLSERYYILQELLTIARNNPELEVILKPRNILGGSSTHKEKHPYEHIFRLFRKSVPPNFRFSYDDIRSFLTEGSCFVSVSSTVLLQAISVGLPAIAISDFSMKNDNFIHFFIGSDILLPLRKVTENKKIKPSLSWSKNNGIFENSSGNALIQRVLELHQIQIAQNNMKIIPKLNKEGIQLYKYYPSELSKILIYKYIFWKFVRNCRLLR